MAVKMAAITADSAPAGPPPHHRHLRVATVAYLRLHPDLPRRRRRPLPHPHPPPPPQPPPPRCPPPPISAAHNLLLLSLSLFMAAGCCSLSAAVLPSRRHLFCFPTTTPPASSLFFYRLRLLPLQAPRVLRHPPILLGPPRRRRRRLSFLHIYHHATVVVMSYLWLDHSQSLLLVAIVTNAVVHVVMYGYYFLCSVGYRPAWGSLCSVLRCRCYCCGCSLLTGKGKGARGWERGASMPCSMPPSLASSSIFTCKTIDWLKQANKESSKLGD